MSTYRGAKQGAGKAIVSRERGWEKGKGRSRKTRAMVGDENFYDPKSANKFAKRLIDERVYEYHEYLETRKNRR